MPDVQVPPPLPKSQPLFGRRHSTIFKLLGVGALVLVLQILLAMITGVLRERSAIVDQSDGQRALHHAVGFKFAFRCAILIDP